MSSSVTAHDLTSVPPRDGAPRTVEDRPSAPGSPEHRLGLFFDGGVWAPVGGDRAEGLVGARGTVDGAPAYAYCSDPARRGGAVGDRACATIVDTIDAAVREAAPVVGLWHSGGARIDQGVVALEGVGAMFSAMVRASGVVPQISVVLGPAAGGAAYGAALTDVVIASDDARMFVTGPDVIRQVTREEVGMRDLGGPEVHAERSGTAHLVAADACAAIGTARRVTSLLRPGQDSGGPPPAPRPALRDVLPARAARAYDVRNLTGLLVDDGLELQPDHAPNIVTQLGRLGPRAVGVLANNPMRMGGCLTAAASEKAARFVRTCDAFGLPVVVLVDVPGYLPGIAEEHTGVLRRGAKLLHAFAGARTPRVTVITRKAYGGAYLAMNARSMGADAVFAWPTAEVAVMGPEAAVDILHRRRLEAADPEDRPGLRSRLVDVQREVGSLSRLVEQGVIDDVIDPADTPARVHAALRAAGSGRSDQRNIPL